MVYLAITQIDAVTGIICTAEPMRTGPSYPQIKNLNIAWSNQSTWPIAITSEGIHTVAPLFFGTCDDDADLTVAGVIATYSEAEYEALKFTEHQARRPYASWVGDYETMTWQAPIPFPQDDKYYFWNEEQLAWVEVT
jgi:hypothetical protein